MDTDRFDKYATGAKSAIDVALWNIQQLINGAETTELETLGRQAYFTICAADTVLQVLTAYTEPDDEYDDDDDEDEGLGGPEYSKG